jgi:AhpD family alkylhydroperoxidase
MAKDTGAAEKDEAKIPGIDYEPGKEGPASYSMIEPRLKQIYAQFYKETYFTDDKALDSKTQELIALACSLVAKCDGCIDGHIKKALKAGASKEEISEAIVIAIGINAAAVVDQTDRAAARLGLNHFPARASRKP